MALAVFCALPSLAAGHTPSASSASPEMLFTQLGSTDGLSQGAVMAIAQDSQGFIWLGTEDGLDRFDGYELRHLLHARANPESLPNNWVSALLRDATGRLWVGTDGGGLAWHDVQNGRFVHAKGTTDMPLVDPNAQIRAIKEDREGRLWVATRSNGVYALDRERKTSTSFRHNPNDPLSLSDDSVFAVSQDLSGMIWVGTSQGLDRIDPRTSKIEAFGERLAAVLGATDTHQKVTALYTDHRGIVWIGLENSLVSLDTATSAFAVMRHQANRPYSMPEGRVTALLEDDARRFWVGSSSGLALLDRGNGRFVQVNHDPRNPTSLPDNYVSSLLQDRSGLLWVGTKTGGVARWNPRSWSFGHHRFADNSQDNVTAFAIDRHDTLWLGSFGAGVLAVDSSGAQQHYRHDPKSPLRLVDDTVMALVVDHRDRVWLGTMSGGVDRLDPAHHLVTHFAADPANPLTLPAPGIMSLLCDTHGRIWVGTYGGGIATIDPVTDRVQRYPHAGGNSGELSGDRATVIVEDRAGRIWVGTDGDGINILDPASGKVAHYLHDPANPASLSSNTVYAVSVDAKGSVWIGTRGGGLDHVRGVPFSGNALTFDNLSEADGLPNSTVYGIEFDRTGTLWASTNNGLAAIRLTDRSVRTFRRNHGLQADEFNFGAHYRSPDGTLYFGGANGYNSFQPEQLQLNETPPPVVLTGLLKLNMRASATPELLDRIDLGYRDAVVTFQYAALDYTGPSENRFSYRLDGFDTNWVDAGNARQATYTHLDGGDYVFRVRAANNDGRWSDTPLAVTMHVSPPPWATWWAKSFYGMAALAVLFLVWFIQHRRVKREMAYTDRLREEVRSRTAELAQRNHDMEHANQQLREVSVSDSLTGLGNRRRLHEAMADLFDASGEGSPSKNLPQCALMIIDLDYLKPINDRYGHESGDAVLVQMASILRREFRSSDLIVRWGGDEFVVLCMDADLAMAGVFAERVRSAVAKQIFRVGDGQVARTSCSIGFAVAPFVRDHPRLLDWEQLLSIADMAMYQAKQQRNNWVGWSASEKAVELPSLTAALAANAESLEKAGVLIVARRQSNPDDTVDNLRILRQPSPR